MKITFPHAGMGWVPIKTLLDKSGIEAVVPPRCSKRTLTLGAKYAPEWMCLPYKVNLGNFIEALELGADTLVHVGGPGLCRLGNYSHLMERTLHDMGYDFDMIIFDWQESPAGGLIKAVGEMLGGNKSLREVVGEVKFGISQLLVLDEIEHRVHYLRPREAQQGTVTRIWRSVGDRVCAAHTSKQLKQVKQDIMAELGSVRLDPSIQPLKVAMLGEFFMVLEPFCNMDVEEELGRMHVEVWRSAWLSGWCKTWIILGALGFGGHSQEVKKAAWPYLRRDVSGDAVPSLGETALLAQHGYDGVVHIMPFTCMPEIIAQNIFPSVSRDYDIPVMHVILDEQMGRAGFMTRIEAFVDLMWRRRMVKTGRTAQPASIHARR